MPMYEVRYCCTFSCPAQLLRQNSFREEIHFEAVVYVDKKCIIIDHPIITKIL